MKLLDRLETSCVSGGIITLKTDAQHHGSPGFVLYGNCNISMSKIPYSTLWNGSDMTLGTPYKVTLTADLEYDTVYAIYNVTKHADKCEFQPVVTKIV